MNYKNDEKTVLSPGSEYTPGPEEGRRLKEQILREKDQEKRRRAERQAEQQD